jgi:succinate dehydrogenase / fumarate reductase flavoprotein subunit
VGGIGFLFGKSTNSIINTGSAHSIAYQQGAFYANGEFIQVHPTAIPAGDKLRLMSESIRGEGGRIWVPRIQGDRRDPRDIPEKDRWYFLEEWYPKYGNLVPRDIASRAIYKVCVEMGMGVFGEKKVYLDVTHLPKATLEKKLGGVLEIYRKFVGKDPTEYPMEVYPAVHYSMGGLWVDYGMMTNIPGLLAAGECEYQQHGANRLGANSLLSCFYDGFVAAETAVQFSKGNGEEPSPSLLQSSEEEVKKILEKTYRMSGPENPYRLHQELGEWMTEYVTIVRSNENLKKTLEKIRELKERWERIGIPDDLPYANHPVLFTIELKNMLELAEVITYGALLRDESRGAHYKVDFPERNDEKFLKTTVAEYTPDGPRIRYEDVDLRYIPPRPRRYDVR